MRSSNLLPKHKHELQYEPILSLLLEAIPKMKAASLSSEFIWAVVQTVLEYEGMVDLVTLWVNETDSKECDEIIADIQEMIDICAQPTKIEHQKIHFNDLVAVANDIRQFKDSLLEIVIENGGISALAEKTGIPQPSLSRFFNSNAMPRRATLLKIGKALNLSAIDVETKWAR